MQILQVITDTDRRGAQVFAVDLQAALVERGHTVTTVALTDGTTTSPLELDVLGAHRRGLGTLRALRRRSRGVDVVVAHGSATAAACAAASIGARTPFVYRQVSDTWFWAGTRTRRARVRRYLGRASLVVALAPSARDDLTANLGLDPARVRVVPNGVPAARFPVPTAAERQDAREAFGLGDAPTAVVISALVPEKAVDDAIDAAAASAGVHLLVAGDGPERAALERRADERMPGRARFLGARPSVADVYAAGDLAVFPSRGGDSMPAALIEAGLSGLPAVTTAVGAAAEVVVDGETGIVVAPGDVTALTRGICELLDGGGAASPLGAAARRRCLERYEIGVVAAGWEAVLVEASAPASA
jgi:glycosyltransferase involved in cell wall biosynthesis